MRLAAALLFVASAAAADPVGSPAPGGDQAANFSFEWNAPGVCPAKADVLARASRLIGHSVARAVAGQPVQLVATVELLADSSWRLNVSSGSHHGSQRSVTASSCDELGEAMALLIALSIDPDYAARLSAESPTDTKVDDAKAATPPAPSSSPAPAPPLVAAVPSSPARSAPVVVGPVEPPRSRSTTPIQLTIAALGAVWLNRLPGVAPGGSLRGALARDRWVFATELGFFPAQRTVQQSVAGDLSLGTLGCSLGYALFSELLTPYAGLELDVLHGIGAQVATSQSGNAWLLGFDAGLHLSYPVQRSVRLFADGHASVLAEQARFYIEPNTSLFQPGRVGAQFGLGAELRLR